MYGLGLIAGQESGDMQQAAIWMGKAANKGLAIAYTALGRMYEIGDPFTQDFQEAARLYEDGARGGEAHAQVCLGQLYERGDGVAKDAEEAFRWYRKAADLGDADALNRLRAEADATNVSQG